MLVLVRHAESARNVANKGNRFFLDDESRKAVQGVADHHVPITDEGRRQAQVTGPHQKRIRHVRLRLPFRLPSDPGNG